MTLLLTSNLTQETFAEKDAFYIAGSTWAAGVETSPENILFPLYNTRISNYGHHHIKDRREFVAVERRRLGAIDNFIINDMFPPKIQALRGLLEQAAVRTFVLDYITFNFKNSSVNYKELLQDAGFKGGIWEGTQVKFLNAIIIDPLVALYNNDVPKVFSLVFNALDVVEEPIYARGDKLPSKTWYSDAGYDLTFTRVISDDGHLLKLGTDLHLEMPPGIYAEIVPRSSIYKSGYILANSVGIIDNTYRGELMGCFWRVRPGAPVPAMPATLCQLIFRRQVFVQITPSSADLTSTSRGAGGFGSTDTVQS